MATSSGSGQGLAAGLDTDLKCVIRFNANQSYEVDISIKDSIRDVKEKLALSSKTPANNINLVLAGQLMGNHRLVEEFGLGSYTTLHAFCWSDDNLPVKDKQNISLTQQTESLSLAKGGDYKADQPPDATNTNGRQRFFVFCKICDSVRPGKLRVQCRKCDSGAFLVDRGPSNWTDISPQTEIRGECKSCHHNIPLFYMRCMASHNEDLSGTSVVLRHVQANRRMVECIICADIMSVILIFPCSDGHVICLDCFKQYGSSSLSERSFVEHPEHGYTLPCPAGCEDAHIQESHHFLVMGKEKYERYKNFAAEEYVLQNDGILCPSPGCGMGLMPDKGGREVYCQECKNTCCKECLREFHYGDCEEFHSSNAVNTNGLNVSGERAQKASWERQSQKMIEESTRACPGCKCKTEKSGGCMHMICSRCHHEWCWLCRKTWDRDCQAEHWFA